MNALNNDTAAAGTARVKWSSALALVAIVMGLALSLALPAGSASAQVTSPTAAPLVITYTTPDIEEDALVDISTATFGGYSFLIVIVGGIALGFYSLRKAKGLMR